jgi:eukaryotic-like serine/threonine-protein kinase
MTTSRNDILELIVSWEEAKARGESPALEELCRDRPERLDEFRRYVEKLGRVDWLNQPLDGITDSTSSPADMTLFEQRPDR